MIAIEKIYRAFVDHSDLTGVVETFAFDIGKELNVESFTGCPACGPYITAEASSEIVVLRWADSVQDRAANLPK